ncbi:hypothetical protein F444_09198 [Phytophthora nicotianae P1976]|uniref:Uncharacterized protein n=1 Tax=Phytophthora nicotianae P1976 TaxID=1317066 RepID=A0A081A8G0_PHYNI|nr:hypothetical protein F444_09198 [Phytophthora nicotianae P1976]
MGVYLAVTLLLFMLVNLRRLMYESVEGVLGGPIGVVFAVFVADVYFEFTRDSCYWSVAVLVVGCYVVEWGSQNRVAIHSDTQCPGLPTDGGGRREESKRASLARLRGVQVKGTPTVTQAATVKSDGTPTGGVPDVAVDKTVRPSSGGAARRGRRGSVGENCHGQQLDGGLAILAGCILEVYSLQGQRATYYKQGQEEQTSAFHV